MTIENPNDPDPLVQFFDPYLTGLAQGFDATIVRVYRIRPKGWLGDILIAARADGLAPYMFFWSDESRPVIPGIWEADHPAPEVPMDPKAAAFTLCAISAADVALIHDDDTDEVVGAAMIPWPVDGQPDPEPKDGAIH